MRRLALLALLAACSASDEPQAPWKERPKGPLDLVASLAASEVPMLGRASLFLDLWIDAGRHAEITPALPEGFAGTIAPPVARVLFGGEWKRWRMELRPVRQGERKIPPFVAKLVTGSPTASRPGEASVATTVELTVQVTPQLADTKSEIEAPAPPFAPFPSAVRAALWIAGALLGLVLLVWLLRRLRRERTEQHPQAIPLPAHVKALRALARLRQQPRISHEQIEGFYVELAQVLRVYLEERWQLHAPERTTEEFLGEAERGTVLRHEQRAQLQRFLQACDLVKFARFVPDDAAHLQTFAIAEAFVETTRPDRALEGAA